MPFYESPRLHVGLLAVGGAVLLLSTLAWAAGAAISWWYDRQSRRLYGKTAVERESDKPARRARLLASAVAVLALLFVVGMMVVLSNASAILGFGASPLLIGVLALPILISVLTVGVLVYAALAWARGYWGLFGRLQYSLVALSALAFVALFGYYNLLGFQF
jgi:cation transport ATPase